MATTTCWTIWCPLGQQCSKKGRQLGRFASEDAARQHLYNHLAMSGYHSDLSDTHIAEVVQNAEVSHWTEIEGEDGQQQNRVTKRPRVAEVSSLQTAITSGVSQAVETLAEASHSAGRASDVEPLAMAPRGSMARDSEVLVSVPRMKQVIDNPRRAESAARQAARISHAAATAFEAEATNIADCRLFFARTIAMTEACQCR